eukprot:SAG31_NODE_2127_length_6390_cov_3.714036_2_plen_153_part_00
MQRVTLRMTYRTNLNLVSPGTATKFSTGTCPIRALFNYASFLIRPQLHENLGLRPRRAAGRWIFPACMVSPCRAGPDDFIEGSDGMPCRVVPPPRPPLLGWASCEDVGGRRRWRGDGDGGRRRESGRRDRAGRVIVNFQILPISFGYAYESG